MSKAPLEDQVAFEISVTGLVQGVGFRPFVSRLAREQNLAGWVRNEAGEVRIVVQGGASSVEAFLEMLRSKAPPLARIDSLTSKVKEPEDTQEFQIVESENAPDRRSPVSPDVAICAACEKELLDPQNRRYRYPFITCTDCGPRFTVIEDMPYDRVRTSMRKFAQCAACSEEYDSPDDRRYHSETNSCFECGPTVWLSSAGSAEALVRGENAIEEAAGRLKNGGIVAVKGLGGFHLAVDSTNETAVQRLRERKNREAKPLAVMVRTVQAAKSFASISEQESALLESAERPIVLLKRLETKLAPSVAPGLDTVGVMTAYTPLHHLLLEYVDRPLVMTSGNKSDEPISVTNNEAVEKLGGIADSFLLHDREIVARYDDSVVRTANSEQVFLRRARGYAPLPLDLPIAAEKPLVAVGPHLKNTFCLAHGDKAYVSQHIGDLDNTETLEHFNESLEAYEKLFRVEPEAVVRDAHPDYLSTRIADEKKLRNRFTVQHHHAHIAAVAGEHGAKQRVIGFAYDGTGYGDDGNIWGAETLIADLLGYNRFCYLRYAPLPGGDVAIREPWRAALGYLSLEPGAAGLLEKTFANVEKQALDFAQTQITKHLNAPLASSMGRLFDAAAAILGVRTISRYEGQAAMELEALAANRKAEPLSFPIVEGDDGALVLDPIPLLMALNDSRAAGVEVNDLAAAFHESIAKATVKVAIRASEATDIRTVALCGGVFQNARLLHSVQTKLEGLGYSVLVPRLLSPNDGAISYGQAVVAAARMQVDSEGTVA